MAQSINTIQYLHQVIKSRVHAGDICIDATAGRGNDTALLAELVGESGTVIAFDIQPMAIASTEMLLKQRNLRKQVNLVQDGHETMGLYARPETVDCIVFNLGYLPSGDHRIATKPKTTVAAIAQGLILLKEGGIMCLAIYHGGDTGFAERNAVLTYLQKIDHKAYTVMVTDFHNRPHHPPLAVVIIREYRKTLLSKQ